MEVIIKDQVSAVLDEIGAKRKNRAVAEAMGLAIVGLAIRSFNDPSVRAAPWAPLAPATIAQKIEEGTSTAILKRHTLLFRSWRVIEATSDFVRVGSDRFYAMFHQFGTKRGLPARPMLPLVGDATSSRLTPLAVKRMVSAAKAALEGFLFNRRRKPSP
jgi:phage gpG-like protein